MIGRVLFGVLFVLAALCPVAVYAQRCDVDYEAIIKLKAPHIGAYNLWDGVHGDQGGHGLEERYVSSAVMPNGDIFAVGEQYSTLSAGEGAKDGALALRLAEIDRRGRVVWQTIHAVKALENVVKVIAVKDRYFVFANRILGQSLSSIWVGEFDAAGMLISQRSIQKTGGLRAYDVVSRKAGGFLMVAAGRERMQEPDAYTFLYRLNTKAQVVSARAYNPGGENALLGISPLKDGHYLASGYVVGAGGRESGWAMKMQDDGSIIWQRQYPRGGGARLLYAREMVDGHLVLGGDVLPVSADAGYPSGWALQIDGRSGDVIWQRYFTGEYHYAVRGLDVNDAGLISVLLDGDPVAAMGDDKGAGQKDFVQLLTLNPRGVIFDSHDLFQGLAADAYGMIENAAGAFVIVGRTLGQFVQEDAALPAGQAPQTIKSHEAWIIALPNAGSYHDPCVPPAPQSFGSP
ncbi:MAG: hypothetical protein ACPGRX_08350 [Bdellovibrionales bacterium]